jgi:hypothetical protein
MEMKIVFLKPLIANFQRFRTLLSKNEISSTKRTISIDPPLKIGVAIYLLAKLRMLDFIIISLMSILTVDTLRCAKWIQILIILQFQKIP